MKRVSVSQLISALEASDGLLAQAAEALGTTRQTIAARISEDTSGDLVEALKGIRECTLDETEGELLKNIRNGNSGDIRFYLETQGKHRGYTKRSETTGVNGGPIRIDLAGVSDDDLSRLTEAIAAGVS